MSFDVEIFTVTPTKIRQKPVKIIVYKTLKECYLSFVGKKAMSDIRDFYWEYYIGGRKKTIELSAWLKDKNTTYWGWARYSGKEIHLWYNENCTMLDLMRLLAHEKAHLRKPRYKNKRFEEKKAFDVADDAEFAYTMAQKLLEKEKK